MMIMKKNIAKIAFWAAAFFGLALGFNACEDEPDRFELTDGLPTIHYVRPIDVTVKDSLLTSAYMGNGICIVGDNLRSVYKLLFNDQEAVLNNSYITDHTLLVDVPNTIPGEVSNKIYFYNKNGDVVDYDFNVLVPGPSIASMSNEFARPGSQAVLYGDYFIDDPNVPLTVSIGDMPVTDIKEINKGFIRFTVPEGADEGEVSVKTVYGAATSVFHYRDSRGSLFNFDTDPHPANHGWHAQVIETDETALDGNFLRLGGVDVLMDADGGWNDGNFSFEYWPGDTWEGVENYPTGKRLTDFADFSDWENMALKFELYVPKANPWSAGSMQLIVGGVEKITGAAAGLTDIDGKTTAGANNTYFNNDELPRGLYTPWVTTGSFDTNDEWITVTVPYSNFIYGASGVPATGKLTASDFTSLTIFVWSGGNKGTECHPVIKIDNIRAVPVK